MTYDPRDFDLDDSHYSDAVKIAGALAVSFMKDHLKLPCDKAAANIQELMHGEVRVGRWTRDRFLYARGLYAWAFFYVYGERITFDKEPDTVRGINATQS
jgi:hypothetical protein